MIIHELSLIILRLFVCQAYGTSLNCHGCFFLYFSSLVVDDVDGDQPSSADEEVERPSLERRSSSASDKEEIDDRVRQMQVGFGEANVGIPKKLHVVFLT